MFRVPDITIATDVICGFPTETAKVALYFLLFCIFIFYVVSLMFAFHQDVLSENSESIL